MPYRSWCPICVKAKGREDAHAKVEIKKEGKPIVVMYYKAYGKTNLEDEGEDKRTSIVMRDQVTGMAVSHFCEMKGPGDAWLVDKLTEDIDSWGRTEIILKSDGEPSIVSLVDKIREKRFHQTIPEAPPAYSPQSNGVAERAVQEISGQLRCMKLALESRLKMVVESTWAIMDLMLEHAAYIVSRCLKGAGGRTPFLRLKGHDTTRPLIEFGEQILASETNADEGLAQKICIGVSMVQRDLDWH